MKGNLILYKNTGSNDPFNARLLFGVMHLRDHIVKNEAERLEFDNLYTPVFESLDDCFECKNELVRLIKDHKEKIAKKEIVSFQNNYEILEIKESIDRKMNKLFKDFFIKGEIALKSLQFLTKKYDLDIGFFFQKDASFKKGIKKLENGNNADQALSKMLVDDRKWRTLFNEIRSRIEHGGLSLGNIKYSHEKERVWTHIPMINSIEVDEVVQILGNNLFEFVEDLIAHMVAKNLKEPLCIVQIPEKDRDPSLPQKYVVGIKGINIKK
ncbi:MAG: hypothetical protein ACOZAN_02280 [Patescibacteria group bacterium]